MKLFSVFVIFNSANGSHFRGGSYQVIPDNDAETVQVTFTHAWRRARAGKLNYGCMTSYVIFKALTMVAIKVTYRHGPIL